MSAMASQVEQEYEAAGRVESSPLYIVSTIAKYRQRRDSETLVVPGAGVEPARCCHPGGLSPLRLPIPPSGPEDI